MLTLRRSPPIEQATHAGRGGRPVLLATIDAPFDEEAAIFAVESALECGQPLIVANVLQIPLGPLCVAMGYGTLEPSKEDAAKTPNTTAVRASAWYKRRFRAFETPMNRAACASRLACT